MTQEQIIEFLENNPGKYYTAKQIAVVLHIGTGSVGRATRQIVKREGFVFRYDTSALSVRSIGYEKNE